MCVYCLNNPVNRFDPEGTISSREMQIDLAFNKNTKYTLKDVLKQQKLEALEKFMNDNSIMKNPGHKVTTSIDNKKTYPGLFVNTYTGVTTQTKIVSFSGGDDVIYYTNIINGKPRFGVSQPGKYLNTDASISLHDASLNIGWGENYVGVDVDWDTFTLNFEKGTTYTSNGLDTTSYSGFSVNIGTTLAAAFLIMSGAGAFAPIFS